mmetsp:Transcript_22683/g.56906  ORF Transcript_22683/g.56906 Transcript_22683/m.56906 type:complete len:83 (+) Transcript_22683:3-251(+)
MWSSAIDPAIRSVRNNRETVQWLCEFVGPFDASKTRILLQGFSSKGLSVRLGWYQCVPVLFLPGTTLAKFPWRVRIGGCDRC